MPATAKQEAQRILDNLPEDATLEQIQYHLDVLQKIEEGQRAMPPYADECSHLRIPCSWSC